MSSSRSKNIYFKLQSYIFVSKCKQIRWSFLLTLHYEPKTHLQCPWRTIKGENLILGQTDSHGNVCYRPATYSSVGTINVPNEVQRLNLSFNFNSSQNIENTKHFLNAPLWEGTHIGWKNCPYFSYTVSFLLVYLFE